MHRKIQWKYLGSIEMYSYELFQTELLIFFMQLSRAEAITWESGKVQSGILTVQMKDLTTLE